MLQYFGGARVPGPLGTTPGGRPPGPLGADPLRFGHEDPAKQGATKATKRLEMPASTKSSTIMRARSVEWKLAASGPATNDVQQGELANCPIAAILAALAHTGTGQKRINSLITEFTPATVTTTLSKQIVDMLTEHTADDPDYKTQDKQVASRRYFSVNLWGGIDVSDVFYVKYSDRNDDVDMVYMDSPTQSLWPCVIEKAYAVKLGNYDELDDDSKHTANEFWEALVGKKPSGFKVDDKTDFDTIRAVAANAGKVPAIAASRDDATKVTSHHAFAVLGISGSTIELYNPYGKTEKISLKDFRASFQTVLYGNP